MKSPVLIVFFTFLWAAITPVIALELRFLNWEGAEEGLKFGTKEKTVSIRADESTLSPVYTYTGSSPLVLFKQVMVEGKLIRQPVASLNIPGGLTHAIVVLAANAGGEGYSGVWVDDSPKSRPAGTIRLINLSNRLVAFKIGTSDFSLPPDQSHQMAVGPETTQIIAKAAAQVGDKWEVIANNPMPVRPKLRLLIVLREGRPIPGYDPSAVDMLSFYDRPPVIPEAGLNVANH